MLSPNILNFCNNQCCYCVDNNDDNDNLIDDEKSVSKPIKIGTSYLLYGKRKSSFPFHCLVGPDWPMIILTYTLIIVVNAVILGVISPLGWIPVMLGLVSACMLLIAYTMTVFSDPGIIYKYDCKNNTIISESSNEIDIENLLVQDNTNDLLATEMQSVNTTNKNTTFILPLVPSISTIECGQCKLQRPYTARHCCYCKVCIDDLDHHCPWSGKCIGKKNLRIFYTFTGLLSYQTYYLLGTFIYYIVYLSTTVPVGKGFT